MITEETWKAALVFVTTAAVVACVAGPRAGGPAPLENPGSGGAGGAAAGPQGAMPAGMYQCSLEQSGYRYPEFPCVVRVGATGATELEKLGGSQRFRGALAVAGDAVSFDGVFFCPWGACDQRLRGQFRATGAGTWEGTLALDNGPMIVRMVYAPDAWGGAAYGGGMYGGGMYGGGMYGGGIYGGGVYGGGGFTHGP